MSDVPVTYSEDTFERIKRYTQESVEYWSARELQKVLDYNEWRNFHGVIEKAMEACTNSGNDANDHFVGVNKMIELAKTATREVGDYQLSRYACYLIVQNGDPRKEIIALGQTYFARRTRQQELLDGYNQLTEDQKRMVIRDELVKHNKSLAEAAQHAGVETPKDFAVFQNHGYQGLYGGLGQKEIHAHKGLKKSQKILDHMGSTELAANLFRATQTDEKLRRDSVKGKLKANTTHFEVGRKVRQTIKDLGGTMPEDLPTPKKSVQAIEREQAKRPNRLSETPQD